MRLLEADTLDLTILYDAARGFLEIRRAEDQLRYALLSLVGATGAAFALWFEREGGRLEPRMERGAVGEVRGVTVPRKLERALSDARGPVPGKALAGLGTAVAKWAKRSGIEMVVPVFDENRLAGLFALGPRLFEDPYSDREVALAGEIANLAATARSTRVGQGARRRPRATSAARRVAALRERYPVLESFRGESDATADLLEELVGLAEFDLPVLILGETGTGKELIAGAVHALSERRTGSFEAINCAAIPRDLMASTLFGHERGAFTGAVSTRCGAFERAGRGTIFLDEIGDMPAETQASLLRVLQEGCFRRVGSETTIPACARVISATNRDLGQAVDGNDFRSDLFYRLQMFSIRIPPLRERGDDVERIAQHLLERNTRHRRSRPAMSKEFLAEVGRRPLPGNVRELESLIVGSLVRAGHATTLLPEHLPASTAKPGPDAVSDSGTGDRTDGSGVPSYEVMERQYIRSVLRLTEGNKREAAELMGIPRTTLNARMKKLGLGGTP